MSQLYHCTKQMTGSLGKDGHRISCKSWRKSQILLHARSWYITSTSYTCYACDLIHYNIWRMYNVHKETKKQARKGSVNDEIWIFFFLITFQPITSHLSLWKGGKSMIHNRTLNSITKTANVAFCSKNIKLHRNDFSEYNFLGYCLSCLCVSHDFLYISFSFSPSPSLSTAACVCKAFNPRDMSMSFYVVKRKYKFLCRCMCMR